MKKIFFIGCSDDPEIEYRSWITFALTIIATFALIVAFFAVICSCNTYKCYPSKGTKDYARLLKIDTLKNGYQLTWRRGFRYFSTHCDKVPDSIKVGKYYSI